MQLDVARAKNLVAQACAEIRDGDTGTAIALLARSLHGLSNADGLDPWDVEVFYGWSVEHLHTATLRDCARFVLTVWNDGIIDAFDTERDNKLGPFDAMKAMARWDHAHRAAFAAWTADPWWP